MAENRTSDRHKPGYYRKFIAENYDQIMLKIRKDTGIKEAVRIVSARKGMSMNEYLTEAVLDKLALDGYIPGEPYDPEE